MADVIHIKSNTPSSEALAAAVDGYLTSADLLPSTVAIYRRTLGAFASQLGADEPVATVDRQSIEEFLDDRYAATAATTYNRHLAAIRSFFSWAVDRELVSSSPAARITRRRPRRSQTAERQARVIPLSELEAYWSDGSIPLRERALVALAYDTAARANELLNLNVDDLDLANRQAVVIGKGGNAEPVFWTSLTARLLPRLIDGRRSGPLFLADIAPTPARRPAAADVCRETGRARLSYRRAAELFKQHSGGYTLHQIRHSRLTHLAEAGEDVTLIKAKSRHASLRTLERYVNPSDRAVADLTDRHDPNRRRR